jgi:hypothetical protein
MEIISLKTRSLLAISGLDPDDNWEIALEHATNLQMRIALPGRCTPFELTYGKQPSILNIRIFGCEALAYREKDKIAKFTPKVDQCIYVGISPNHSNDTYKLLSIKTNRVIYRCRVFFNERSFPARTTKTMFKAIKEDEDVQHLQIYLQKIPRHHQLNGDKTASQPQCDNKQ